jgi:hypothetical protein
MVLAKSAIMAANSAQHIMIAAHVLMATIIRTILVKIVPVDVNPATTPLVALSARLATFSPINRATVAFTCVFHAIIPTLASPAMMDIISII